jgi:hypothetical protein
MHGGPFGSGGPAYEELPAGSAKPVPSSGVRTTPGSGRTFGTVAPTGSPGTDRPVGSGTLARPASLSLGGASQNSPSPYSSSAASQKPASLQPTIIGPTGYDDLK